MDILTCIFIVCLNISIFGLIIFVHYRRMGSSGRLFPFYFPALVYKVMLGLALGALYHFYYRGGDTIYLFEDATRLARLAVAHPLRYLQILLSEEGLLSGLHYAQQPRALLFAKMISFFSLLTGYNYWLTSVYFSLISFCAVWYLSSLLVRYFDHAEAVSIAFLFYPSFVFWSAGIIKESVAVALVCMIAALALHWVKEQHSKLTRMVLLFWFLIFAMLLWKIKYYDAAVAVPIVLSVAMLGRLKISPGYQIMGMLLMLTVLIAGMSRLHPNLHFSYFLEVLVANHDMIRKASDGKDVIHFQHLQPTWTSLLYHLPLAAFSGLFRPFPWDGSSWLHVLTGLENLVLSGIVLLGLYRLFTKKVNIKEKVFFTATVMYILILSVFLAISSPNFGTLMRYKAVYLPFVLYLGLLGCQPWIERIISEFSGKPPEKIMR